MSYINLTETIVAPCVKAAGDASRASDPFKHHFVGRVIYALTAPLSLATGTADTVIGLAFRIISIATVGAFPRVNLIARDHMKSLKELISKPYFYLLRAINIHAKVDLAFNCVGYIAEYSKVFKDNAREYKRSKDFLDKHVISRLSYALFGIASLVTRAVDQFISKILAPISLLTLGIFPKVNEIAYCSLMFPNLLNDLTYSVIKVINPWASAKVGGI